MTFRVRPCVDAQEASEVHYPWGIKEDWDPGLAGKDIKFAYFPTDPTSFLVGTTTTTTTTTATTEQQEQKGQQVIIKEEEIKENIVSAICAIKHGDNKGFMALYIVGDPTQRKKGYGLRLFQHALHQHLAACPWVGLDAVEEQMENYKRSGFIHQQGSITRYIGDSNRISTINNENAEKETQQQLMSRFEEVDLASASPTFLKQLVDLDEQYTKMRRPTFLHHWIQYHAKHGWGLALVDCQDQQQEHPVGFACMRQCASGTYRIGPIYADTMDQALDLVTRLMAKVPEDAKFTTDAWMGTPETKQLFEDKLGWKPLATFYRSWRRGDNNSSGSGADDDDDTPSFFESSSGMNGFYSIVSAEVG